MDTTHIQNDSPHAMKKSTETVRGYGSLLMYIASQLVYTIYIFNYMSAERLQKKVHMFF